METGKDKRARLCGKQRTLEEAIEFAQLTADNWRVANNNREAANQEQVATWLRELQTLRAAMNMEPALVTG